MIKAFEFGECVGFFVRITICRIETFFEFGERVGLVIGRDDILSLPCRGGRAFEVGQDEGDLRPIQGRGFSEFDISFAFLQKLFALDVASREFRRFVGFEARLSRGRHDG